MLSFAHSALSLCIRAFCLCHARGGGGSVGRVSLSQTAVRGHGGGWGGHHLCFHLRSLRSQVMTKSVKPTCTVRGWKGTLGNFRENPMKIMRNMYFLSFFLSLFFFSMQKKTLTETVLGPVEVGSQSEASSAKLCFYSYTVLYDNNVS